MDVCLPVNTLKGLINLKSYQHYWMPHNKNCRCSASVIDLSSNQSSSKSRSILSPWVLGAFSQEIKRPGREVDHSPPTSAEVKKTWIYTPTPPYAFMAYCLIQLSTVIILLLIMSPYDSTPQNFAWISWKRMSLLVSLTPEYSVN
jgi:hypothetical protein